MKPGFLITVIVLSAILTMAKAQNANQKTERVLTIKGQQVTGVSVSSEGRIFANFPRWRANVDNAVIEVTANGSYHPYPTKTWNRWSPGSEVSDSVFIAVQSVLAFEEKLYVLDTRNPLWKGVVDAPRIFVFNLKDNVLEDILVLTEGSYETQSYTNDLRIDKKHNCIYITDSNRPALIVYDLKRHQSRRVLAGHFSTTAETDHLSIDGKKWGNKPSHADGIALNLKNGRLYYHALTGYTLYSVATEILSKGTEAEIERSVKKEKITPAPDGMIFDGKGNLYIGDLEHHKIVYLKPSGDMGTLYRGEDAGWADTFSIYNGYLYFTNSRINEAKGDVSELGFTISKIKLP